jgi:hypothetical protein
MGGESKKGRLLSGWALDPSSLVDHGPKHHRDALAQLALALVVRLMMSAPGIEDAGHSERGYATNNYWHEMITR